MKRTTQRRRTPSTDLHGNAPDDCSVALLLIDVINEFAFEGGEALARRAVRAAQRLADLKERAARAGVPCIYVNDNFGRWRSDFGAVVKQCGRAESRGVEVVALLKPRASDYFVLKPKHSGFYETSLDILLKHLGTRVLVLGGFTTESCVMFTAHDAYLRDLSSIVPVDGTASMEDARKRLALAHLEQNLKAMTPPCAEIKFDYRGKRAGVRVGNQRLI